jgi:hypothetical protein
MDSTLRSRRTRLKLSYFQRRLDWSSTDWNPSLAVKEGTAYVSWNGATEVESWNFISMGNFVALRKKTDFETAMKLDEVLGPGLCQHGCCARRGRSADVEHSKLDYSEVFIHLDHKVSTCIRSWRRQARSASAILVDYLIRSMTL